MVARSVAGESTETAVKHLNFDDKQFVNHAAARLSKATKLAIADASSSGDNVSSPSGNHPGHRRP